MEINKEILVKALKEYRYEDACHDGNKPSPLETWEDVHDACIYIFIDDVRIEEDDDLYEAMLNIINDDWEDIADEVNDYIDEECQPYYGDPAFSSASDYWNYILG